MMATSVSCLKLPTTIALGSPFMNHKDHQVHKEKDNSI